MRRREVFQNGQSLAEVGANGRFDDLAGRLAHQTSHTGKLPDLVDIASCGRRQHHVDRVNVVGIIGATVAFQIRHHALGDFFAGVNPDVNDLVVSFAVGNRVVVEIVLDAVDAFLRGGDDLGLVAGNFCVGDSE